MFERFFITKSASILVKRAEREGWIDPNVLSDAVLQQHMREAITKKEWDKIPMYAAVMQHREGAGLKRKRVRKPKVAPTINEEQAEARANRTEQQEATAA